MVKYQPHEAALLRRVYETILSEPWFNRNAITERELLKLVLERHAAHSGDAKALTELCLREARARFSVSR